MLDVARHFFGVADVKRFVDLMALYKLNRLHLHLSDDQGWRIEIKSWPRLTEVGGSTQVGGGPSGYYTQAEYADLVAYAQARYITVVPEIDTPGHTNAALAAYAELNADEQARELYTGTQVGFSTLNVDSAITYQFLDDVIRELAALTPGPVIHIGGDEAAATPHDEYLRFVERIQPIVHKYGKQVAGWEEIGQGTLQPGTLVQYWNTMSPRSREFVVRAVAQGARLIVSPASKVYLDMKYTEATPLGLSWAGYVEAQTAYDWDPASFLPGIDAAAIAGVEAALWAETITTFDDIAFMTLPRLASVAEVAWSPAEARNWEEHRQRLAAQAPRWQALDVHYYPSPQVPWEE
jgi:hexosaminidase